MVKLLYYLYIHVQSVKTYNWTVHEYKRLFWLLSFFKLRERVVYKIFGYKGKMSPKLLILFSTGFHWRIFFFHGLIDFVLFLVLAWGTRVSHVSVILLSSTRSRWLWFDCHEPCSKTNILILYFRWGEGSPTSVLGSQPIIWLLSLSPSDVRRPEVTKYQHLLSPLWPTFSLNGHFLTAR